MKGVEPGMDWKIGCAGFSMKLSEYFREFNLVEVQETFFDPPKERTLARWRKAAPVGFAFSLRAWQLITHPATYPGYQRIRRSWDAPARDRFGFFQPGEQTLWAWEVVQRAAEILGARAVVFQTPASFTPTRGNRENLRRFFTTIERGAYHLVWEPDGIWEPEETEGICRECGLVPGLDPLLVRPASGDIRYFRMREKTRGRSGYTEDDFFRIRSAALDAGEGAGEGFFVWQTPNAARDASRFAKWLSMQG